MWIEFFGGHFGSPYILYRRGLLYMVITTYTGTIATVYREKRGSGRIQCIESNGAADIRWWIAERHILDGIGITNGRQ
jgi:hypothetical protein